MSVEPLAVRSTFSVVARQGSGDNLPLVVKQRRAVIVSPEDLKQQKEVEFYATSVTAWYNTALERDRGLFTLSAGGIGLLLTLLTTVGLKDLVLVVLYVCTILAFLTSVGETISLSTRAFCGRG